MEKEQESLATESISDAQLKQIKQRRLKNRLGMAGICLVVLGVSGVSVWQYLSTRKNGDNEAIESMSGMRAQGQGGDMVTASGTTSIGIDAVTFDIDFLEDTDLYVDEVYLSNGDTVAAGDKYIKFTQESIDNAREELKSTALSADLSYRSSVITNGESKLKAKYTYDLAILEAQYAQQVYDDTIARLDAEFAAAQKAYQTAQDEYNEYYYKVENNTFYEDFEVEKLKAAYYDAYYLWLDRKEYWDVTDDELSSGSGSGSFGGSGSSGSSGSSSSFSMVNTFNASETQQEGDSEQEDASEQESETSGEGEKPGGDKRPDDKMRGGPSSANREEQEAANDRKWILRTMELLEAEVDEAKEEYEQAQEDYEKEIEGAELKLQTLLNKLETAREDFTDASVKYQKESLSAKTTYETTVAKGQTAQNDYNTQLTSLEDTLDRLKDAKEEADDNLALFEELVGDGYLYTESAGTVLMIRAEEGQALAGGDMILAYSNADEISVSVSVSQEDIAKLYVGERAAVMLSEYGRYEGVIESINPIASSDSRTSVTYTVTVALEGDVSALEANLTATVIFGEMNTNQREGGRNE